ncbi:MAG: arabinose-5-phosphate isomerase [Planctomycetota bacterium]|jgi:arabinose-5-phosphate isomerase
MTLDDASNEPAHRAGGPSTAMGTPSSRGAEVLRVEAAAIARLADLLVEGERALAFDRAVLSVLKCAGQTVVTGMGKAGLVGQKISATLASTGTPSFFLHPSEALHGDLGRVRSGDVVLALSNSGETAETNQVMAAVKKLGVHLIGVTGRAESPLGQHSDVLLDIGRVDEACPMKLAPTASTTVMLALGDALAMAVLEERGFGPRDYARFHPGGSLGRGLLRVDEVMRQGDALPLVRAGITVADALIQTSKTKGRPGASLVVDDTGALAGIFTDGDLRRLLEGGSFERLNQPIDDFMARNPKVLAPDDLAVDAHRLLRENRIDMAPVVDQARRPVGLIDVQDLIEVGI